MNDVTWTRFQQVYCHHIAHGLLLIDKIHGLDFSYLWSFAGLKFAFALFAGKAKIPENFYRCTKKLVSSLPNPVIISLYFTLEP